ncbi:MAG: biotin--[acetyl-CoA-carboxylase] ligase [Alistipes sp.]|nr:biotin--[acetyl-CoA-carboxylase] ligase [Alistipes sp.]
MIYRLATTTSTNDEARDARYRHGDAVWAERQTAGRGQRGHVWHSPEGENLTFSLVLEPRFLPVNEQFLLSEAVALALTDTFAHYGIATRIKWTNDIYAGDRKLVGMLLEHNCSGPNLARTIAGIGINVNQTAFDPALPNPVSMAQLAGRTFDREEVLGTFLDHCGRRFEQLRRGDRGRLQEDYRNRMYRLGERHAYRIAGLGEVEGTIEGVRPAGELMVRLPDGSLGEYLFGEIEFVIAEKR